MMCCILCGNELQYGVVLSILNLSKVVGVPCFAWC